MKIFTNRFGNPPLDSPIYQLIDDVGVLIRNFTENNVITDVVELRALEGYLCGSVSGIVSEQILRRQSAIKKEQRD